MASELLILINVIHCLLSRWVPKKFERFIPISSPKPWRLFGILLAFFLLSVCVPIVKASLHFMPISPISEIGNDHTSALANEPSMSSLQQGLSDPSAPTALDRTSETSLGHLQEQRPC
jgi:hypothetical protein